MIHKKTMPVLRESRRKQTKRSGKGSLRVTIPYSLAQYIDIRENDFMDWEVDTDKNTLTGVLVINHKVINSRPRKPISLKEFKRVIEILNKVMSVEEISKRLDVPETRIKEVMEKK